MKTERELILEFAKFLKELKNPFFLGAVTGTVVVAPPNLQVKLESGIIIKKHKIMLSIEKINGYCREFKIDGEIQQDMNYTSSDMIPAGQGPHKHKLISFGAKGSYTSTGKITWTDTLKVGDIVLMLPTNNHKYFYLIDRVVML